MERDLGSNMYSLKEGREILSGGDKGRVGTASFRLESGVRMVEMI